jgi:hypothetical protein
MIGSAIIGGIIGASLPWVLQKANKPLMSREGLTLAVAYGAVAGFVLGIVF